MSLEFETYMRRALDLAREAAAAGEVPVGCVIADAEGKIIGEGRNRREATRLVRSHAEMDAIDMACAARGDWRLDDCTLFVTLEPCPMCAGAMINARLGRLVYAARDSVYGSCAGVLNLFAENYPAHTAIYAGIMAAESERILKEFFSSLRQEQ